MYLIDRDWCMISTRASFLLYTRFFQYEHVYSSICTVACGQSVRTEFCGVGLLSMQIYHASKLRACGDDTGSMYV